MSGKVRYTAPIDPGTFRVGGTVGLQGSETTPWRIAAVDRRTRALYLFSPEAARGIPAVVPMHVAAWFEPRPDPRAERDTRGTLAPPPQPERPAQYNAPVPADVIHPGGVIGVRGYADPFGVVAVRSHGPEHVEVIAGPAPWDRPSDVGMRVRLDEVLWYRPADGGDFPCCTNGDHDRDGEKRPPEDMDNDRPIRVTWPWIPRDLIEQVASRRVNDAQTRGIVAGLRTDTVPADDPDFLEGYAVGILLRAEAAR